MSVNACWIRVNDSSRASWYMSLRLPRRPDAVPARRTRPVFGSFQSFSRSVTRLLPVSRIDSTTERNEVIWFASTSAHSYGRSLRPSREPYAGSIRSRWLVIRRASGP